MNINYIIKSTLPYLHRQKIMINGAKAQRDKVNLEFFKDELNLGDILSKTICDYMLSLRELDFSSASKKQYTHLYAIGSLLGGRGVFDATVWGSGIRSFSEIAFMGINRHIQKLDIRAVRGPVTASILAQAGHYEVPEIYGDPAILLPLVYPKERETIKGKVGVIEHFLSADINLRESCAQKINIKTDDYKKFVDEVTSCEKIISSSLHGIIISEAYGVPAIFLSTNRQTEMLKYFDWYYSTNRMQFPIAKSIDEALNFPCASVPNLDIMRQNLIECFPYDLWR